MPSKTKTQQRFMGAELARKRAGKKTKTGMREKQLRDFAKRANGDNPMPKKKGYGKRASKHAIGNGPKKPHKGKEQRQKFN